MIKDFKLLRGYSGNLIHGQYVYAPYISSENVEVVLVTRNDDMPFSSVASRYRRMEVNPANYLTFNPCGEIPLITTTPSLIR